MLYFMVGLPRSGKSTIAKRWLDHKSCYICNGQIIKLHHYKETNPRVVVNADQIRLALYGQRWWEDGENMVHALKNFMIRVYLNSGYDVLVDGTHTTANSIKELLRLNKAADFCLVDTSAKICAERAKLCGQEDLIERGVIDRMDKQLSQWKHIAVTFVDELRKEI